MSRPTTNTQKRVNWCFVFIGILVIACIVLFVMNLSLGQEISELRESISTTNVIAAKAEMQAMKDSVEATAQSIEESVCTKLERLAEYDKSVLDNSQSIAQSTRNAKNYMNASQVAATEAESSAKNSAESAANAETILQNIKDIWVGLGNIFSELPIAESAQ